MTHYLQEIVRQRHILYAKVYSDLKNSVSSTVLKYFWWILEPLLLVAIYTLLIHNILNRGGPDYPSFVFCGLIVWLWFSRAVTQGSSVLVAMKNVLNQTKLSLYPLLAAPIIINFIYFIIGLIILMLFRHQPTLYYLELIPLFILQFLLCLGLISFLAVIESHFRDTKNILSFVMRAWMYLSPVIYSAQHVLNSPHLTETTKIIYSYNPMTILLVNYQNILLYHRGVDWQQLGILFLISLLLLEAGVLLIRKFENHIVKALVV